MKQAMAILLGIVVTLLLSFNVLAYTPPPAPTDGFLLDQAHVLSSGEASCLRYKLAHINANTKNQIAVLTLASLDGENIDDVAHAVFNSRGVGRKGLDNGVLLVWALGDRKIRIETGKGVGGELTDLQSNDIIQRMKPDARAQRYAAAINLAADSINSALDNRKTTTNPTGGADHPNTPAHNSSGGCDSSGTSDVSPGTVVMVIIIIFVLLLLVARRRNGGGGSWGTGGGSWGSSSGGGSSDGGFGGGDSGGGGSSDSY